MSAVSNDRPWRAWLPAALSAALAVLLYAHTLGGTWIYDDLFHAQQDPRLEDVARWREFWTQGYAPGGVDHLWRPLVSLSYAVQWKLGGGKAWPFHAVNVLLHAGASALVAELARRLTGRAGVALVAGLLFAAHPVHVEGVAYIVGRGESACAVGTLGALVLCLRPLTIWRALAIFGCVVVAILSKEQGLLLPGLLLAIWPARRGILGDRAGPAASRERAAIQLLLLMVLFGLSMYVSYREYILPWTWDVSRVDYATQPMARSALRDRLLIPIALVGRAGAMLAAPVKMAPEYGLAVITSRQDLADPYLYAGAVCILAAAAGVATAARRRAWGVLFLLLGAGLTYSMVSNVSLIGVVFAERLLYLPSAFLLILAAIGLARWLPGRALAVVTILLIAALGLRTVTYAARWNDRLSFYERSLRESPQSVQLRVLVASELMERRQWAEAQRLIDEALAMADYPRLWIEAARVAIEQGRLDQAEDDLDRAWRFRMFGEELAHYREQIRIRRAATMPATRGK